MAPLDINGTANGAKLPILARTILVVGPMTAIVLFLVYMGAMELPKIRDLTQKAYEETIRNREMIREQNAQMRANNLLLRSICSSAAKMAKRDDGHCYVDK